jgi:hypothetical protein
VNSVIRDTIDIRNEMHENNMIMTRQFGLMNRNIRRVALITGQHGVPNREDHNQQQGQASMLVGGSLNNAEGGDAGHNLVVINSISTRAPLSPLPQIYSTCSRSSLRESEEEGLKRIYLFLCGVM